MIEALTKQLEEERKEKLALNAESMHRRAEADVLRSRLYKAEQAVIEKENCIAGLCRELSRVKREAEQLREESTVRSEAMCSSAVAEAAVLRHSMKQMEQELELLRSQSGLRQLGQQAETSRPTERSLEDHQRKAAELRQRYGQ